MDLTRLKNSIALHEGFRSKPYKDTKGKLTIGFGRNLDDVPLSEEEGWYLAKELIQEAVDHANLVVHDWNKLNDARQNVLVELIYNMGLGKVLKFKLMRAALDSQDYVEAAKQLLLSNWTKDVGPLRSRDMALQLETGEWV